MKHLNKFLLLKIFRLNFEILLNILLFFIVHLIKLSAAILRKSWFVCLKTLPVCLHLFPECEYLVSEKIPKHRIQSEVLRDILLLTPKGQMTLEGIPREAEMNHSYFTFPRMHQVTLWPQYCQFPVIHSNAPFSVLTIHVLWSRRKQVNQGCSSLETRDS